MAKNNILNVEFSHAENKEKTTEIIWAICALLNCNGGELNIHLQEETNGDVEGIIRAIEQRFADIIGCLAMCKKVMLKSFAPRKVTFWIEGMSNLCTLNYNLWLPSETQVKCVDPNEPISVIERIVEGKQKANHRRPETTLGSHRRVFVKGESCGNGLEQSSNVQCRPLKPGSIADQITNKDSKFRMNVSAMANASGGHIYHGISDGRVIGVEVVDQQEIIDKVQKTMKTITWPMYGGVQKGKHWDIHFEPAEDATEDNTLVVPGTFVIVFSVVPCRGGVFLGKPESYRVVKDKVERMSFYDWKRELLWRLRLKESQNFDECMKSLAFPELERSLLRIVEPRRSWSLVHEEPGSVHVSNDSSKMQLLFCKVNEKSMYLKNNGDRGGFHRFMKRVETGKQKFCQTEVSLIVLAHKISFAYTTGSLQKAATCLREYQSILRSSFKNLHSIFHHAQSYLESALERAKGNFEKSYKLATEAAAAMAETLHESASHGLLAAWFNAKVAIILTILATKEKKIEKREKLRRTVQSCHDKALAASVVAKREFPTAVFDLQQKVFLNDAFLHLGCSLSGDINKESVADEDVEIGKNCLMVVSKFILDGNSLSRLREVQLNLGLCALFLRRSHRLNDGEKQKIREQRREKLKIAFGYANKALKLAAESHFEELCCYSKNYLTVLIVNLIGNTHIRYPIRK